MSKFDINILIVEILCWLKDDELLSYKTLLIFYWLTTLGARTMGPKKGFYLYLNLHYIKNKEGVRSMVSIA